MVRVVLAKVALLLAIRGCSAIDDDADAQESCDGEASSLLQTAGGNVATTTSAPVNAGPDPLMFTTSADACKACYGSYVPEDMKCTYLKCTKEMCDTDKGYTFGGYDAKDPAPSKAWKACPSKASLPTSYTHVQDACMACPRFASKAVECFTFHCTKHNCGTENGYAFINAEGKEEGAPWTKCPTP